MWKKLWIPWHFLTDLEGGGGERRVSMWLPSAQKYKSVIHARNGQVGGVGRFWLLNWSLRPPTDWKLEMIRGKRKRRENNSTAADVQDRLPTLLPPPTPEGRPRQLIAPGARGATSGVTGVWPFLCPVPLLCVLGSVSSLLPINIYSSYMPLQIGLILAYFWDRDAPVQPASWGIGRSTFFFFFPFLLIELRERKREEGRGKQKKGRRKRENKY